MNKLHYFKLVSLLLIVLFTTLSCSNDDDNDDDDVKIIGTWVFTHEESHDTEDYEQDRNIESWGWVITLNKNGNYTWILEDEDMEETGRWTLLNHQLTLHIDNSSYKDIFTVVKLEGNTLILEQEDDGYYVKYTLKRK